MLAHQRIREAGARRSVSTKSSSTTELQHGCRRFRMMRWRGKLQIAGAPWVSPGLIVFGSARAQLRGRGEQGNPARPQPANGVARRVRDYRRPGIRPAVRGGWNKRPHFLCFLNSRNHRIDIGLRPTTAGGAGVLAERDSACRRPHPADPPRRQAASQDLCGSILKINKVYEALP